MEKKILITGGEGGFAKNLLKVTEGDSQYEILHPAKNELNICSLDSLKSYFKSKHLEFNYVIHAAAITRPMAIHNEDIKLSITTNIIGTSNIVLICELYKKKIIYISTDFVYEGLNGNYSEQDPLKPFTNYGWSKLGGECAVKMYKNHLILRMAMTERPFPHDKAFYDMKKSSIYIDEAAETTLKLLDSRGTINVGGISKTIYEFAKEDAPFVKKNSIKDIKDIKMPSDISMNIDKLKKLL